MASDFPRTYDQWRHCITVDCGIDLTESFIEARLQALGDATNTGTGQFVELYGDGCAVRQEATLRTFTQRCQGWAAWRVRFSAR